MRGLMLVIGCVVFLSLLSLSLHAQEVDMQQQLDIAFVRLERALQEHERCTKDYALLWTQSRKLSTAYQQLQQELAAAKPPPAPESGPAPTVPSPSLPSPGASPGQTLEQRGAATP